MTVDQDQGSEPPLVCELGPFEDSYPRFLCRDRRFCSRKVEASQCGVRGLDRSRGVSGRVMPYPTILNSRIKAVPRSISIHDMM